MKAFFVFVICLVVILGGIFVVGLTSCDKPQINTVEGGETAKPNKNYCSAPNAIFKVGLSATGDFIHHYHEEVIAVGTVFIAIFTIVLGLFTVNLAGATDKIVKGAEEATRRQLRAYVSVEPTDVFNFGTKERVGISVHLKNHGGTPASELSHDFSMGLLPNPLPTDFVYPETTDQFDTNSTLFPGSILPVRFFHSADLSDDEVDLIEKDTQRFHFWGVTSYRDAFGKVQTTKMRTPFGGPDFALTTSNFRKGKLGTDGKARPGWVWTWGNGHNDAT